MIETQSIAPTMSKSAQDALAAMFASLAAHFGGLGRGRVMPLGRELLEKIDIAIGEATASKNTHASVAAIVGMRQTLFPGATPYRPVGVEQTDPALSDFTGPPAGL